MSDIPATTQAEIDAERHVVGICLAWPNLLAELEVDPEAFIDPRANIAMMAMRHLEQDKQPNGLLAIQHYLEARGRLIHVGAYLTEAVGEVATGTNLAHYAGIVAIASLRRRIALLSSQALDAARRFDEPEEILGQLTRDVAALTVGGRGEQRIRDLVRDRFRQLGELADAKAKGQVGVTGIPTGINGLDAILGGLQPGIPTVAAGRPGMGKSAFALGCVRNASRLGLGVHVFSLEDTREAYVDRVLAGESGVSAQRIRQVELNRGEMQSIADAEHRSFSKDPPWLVEDRAGITADELVRSVRRRLRDNGTRLVVVDYIQLLKPPRGIHVGEEAVTYAMNAIADAAKQDGIAYLVLAQLNRECERRDDKRPMLSDLKQSGAIEERAKCVLFLYRPFVYSEVDEFKHPYPETRIELLVAKFNQGQSTARHIAHWDGPTMQIE